MSLTKDRFGWIEFYEAVAGKLLGYQSNRKRLVEGIHKITERAGLSPHRDLAQKKDDKGFPLEDICPFTSMSLFNQRITDKKRNRVAAELADFLGIEIQVPDSFGDSIPTLRPDARWFFPHKWQRPDDQIDALWSVLAAAVQFADSGHHREEFARTYDAALGFPWVGWRLSLGLYWARPRIFPAMVAPVQSYLQDEFGLDLPKSGKKFDSGKYLRVIDDLNSRFKKRNLPVNSIPALMEAASPQKPPPPPPPPPPIYFYTVDNILEEGCFLPRDEIEQLFGRLREKKNLILQGTPGTGKTWIAKRLAFALQGSKDESKVRTVQFHPNLSYEDFVRGWRPSGDQKLEVVDGPFLEAVQDALKDPQSKFTVVIEEINRGNPAQVFGEMLTLLETDKRMESEAIELIYPDKGGSRLVYIPPNLHVIGTMNIADRSLALMDFAFRRRFSFVTLEPRMNAAWHGWVVDKCGIDPQSAGVIRDRINSLNEVISEDLGSHSRIGHSYVTPAHPVSGSSQEWFRVVVETEIAPLLEEYWFDSPEKVNREKSRLLEGW